MNRIDLLSKWSEAMPVLDKGFLRIVDVMGDDAAICQMARTSYGAGTKTISDDTTLIRYLIRHLHTSPLEGCVVKFHVKMPMDCARQWIRHRTMSLIEPSQCEYDEFSLNEVSTRYSIVTEDIAETSADGWRLQSKDNKQGSSGLVVEWPEGYEAYIHSEDGRAGSPDYPVPGQEASGTPGLYLSLKEKDFHRTARKLYEERLQFGVAREQARKDLPLSQYTEFYVVGNAWNVFHFLRLRLDSHAQLEIRSYAEVLARFCADWLPVAWKAFSDYAIEAKTFSYQELELIRGLLSGKYDKDWNVLSSQLSELGLTKREFQEFRAKIGEATLLS